MIALSIIAILLLGLVGLYIHDRTQTTHTILRNYPILGYFRYFAETMGEYMRQYQYLPDWAERPFNRLERAWVYRSAKGVSNLTSFGSENVPSFVFRNAAFPVLDGLAVAMHGQGAGTDHGPIQRRERRPGTEAAEEGQDRDQPDADCVSHTRPPATTAGVCCAMNSVARCTPVIAPSRMVAT